MSDEDRQLIEAATDLLKSRYHEPEHTVAAAVLASDGQIITAINSHHFNGFVCAEMAALDQAINQNITDIDIVVGVKLRNGEAQVINPCGKCRQIYVDYAPNTSFLINDSGDLVKKSVAELLPYAYVVNAEVKT